MMIGEENLVSERKFAFLLSQPPGRLRAHRALNQNASSSFTLSRTTTEVEPTYKCRILDWARIFAILKRVRQRGSMEAKVRASATHSGLEANPQQKSARAFCVRAQAFPKIESTKIRKMKITYARSFSYFPYSKSTRKTEKEK